MTKGDKILTTLRCRLSRFLSISVSWYIQHLYHMSIASSKKEGDEWKRAKCTRIDDFDQDCGLEWFRWSGHWYSHSGDAASLVSEENKIKIKIPQIQEIPIFSTNRKINERRPKVFSPWEELQVDHLPSSRGIQEPETGRYTGAWAFGSVSESWFFSYFFWYHKCPYIHKDMGVEGIIWKSQNHIFSVGKLPLWQNFYIVCAEFNLKSIYPVGSCIVLLAIWSAMVSTFSRHKLSPILADL